MTLYTKDSDGATVPSLLEACIKALKAFDNYGSTYGFKGVESNDCWDALIILKNSIKEAKGENNGKGTYTNTCKGQL